MVRLKEVTYDASPEVVFDLAFSNYGNTDKKFLGYSAYRSHRIPDLYSILPEPVEDLGAQFSGSVAVLQFSGSVFNTYTIQASTDLRQWRVIGTAQDMGNGNFQFADIESSKGAARYYRVVSE